MELILISSNKLKVTLSNDEAVKYNIPIYDSSSLLDSKTIHTLLKDINKASGFDTQSDNLLFEIFESRGGGCEIFITRNTLDDKKAYSKTQLAEICKSCLSYNNTQAYVFDSAEDLYSACRALNTVELSAYSTAYCDFRSKYYLVLRPVEPFGMIDSQKLLSTNEFGVSANPDYLREYLSEHANVICKDRAVQILGGL